MIEQDTKEIVRKVAELAKIRLGDELASLAKDIDSILRYFDVLRSVELDGQALLEGLQNRSSRLREDIALAQNPEEMRKTIKIRAKGYVKTHRLL